MIPPIENSELVGHEAIEKQLLRLMKQEKLPHALLFGGPQGIGKATLAYRLARYLLAGGQAEEPAMGLFGPEPVEESLNVPMDSPPVQRVIAGSHGDLLVIRPEADEKRKTSADTIFIEQVRRVIDFMHHTPAESDWRVVIVDPAEAMNTNAANALLKVLEEPPAQAVLILVSHQPGRLLPTIRSRCRRFDLRPPTPEQVHAIFTQQQAGIEAEQVELLLQLAKGSPGRALLFQQQDALTVYRHLLACLVDPQAAAVQKLAAEAAKSGPEGWAVWRAMLPQLLYRLVVSARDPARFTPLDEAEAQAFQTLHARHSLARWLDLWEKAETLLPEVSTLTLDKKQVMLSLLFGAGEEKRAA